MKLKQLAYAIIGFLVLSTTTSGCKKDSVNPGNDNDTNKDIHTIDPRLVGKWMWTEGSDAANYDDNGTYTGTAYGFATQFVVNANGYGTCFEHMFSTIGAGTNLAVDISYKGFFETDDQGHMGFFPTSGTYKSSSGENRALRSDELWNTLTNSGRKLLFQNVTFTTQGGRVCFQVTSSDNITDTFFKLP